MTSLFEDPKQIIRTDKIDKFWPTDTQSAGERVNATARFIIYATCFLYLIRRDVRIFVLGGTALGVLYVMHSSGMIKDGSKISEPIENPSSETYINACQMPNQENPLGNVLLTDFDGRPDRPSACYSNKSNIKKNINALLTKGIPYGPSRSRSSMPEYQRNAFSRQFVTSPVSNIPGDQTAFAEGLYGKKDDPMCKTHPEVCDPNARGVQLGAFSGLDYESNKRSGMHGGSV